MPADHRKRAGTRAAAAAGFVLLIGLWWPTFRYGLGPTESGSLPVRAGLPLHFVTLLLVCLLVAIVAWQAVYVWQVRRRTTPTAR